MPDLFLAQFNSMKSVWFDWSRVRQISLVCVVVGLGIGCVRCLVVQVGPNCQAGARVVSVV